MEGTAMRNPLAAVLLALLCACYPKGWPPNRPGYVIRDFAYDAGPYLVRMDEQNMAVVCVHNLKTPPTVRWWVRTATTGTPKRTHVTAQRRGDLWVAQLSGLPPDKPLRYAFESELGLVGPFDFRSDRKRGSEFRFAAFGDTRNGHQVHRNLVERLAKEDIDFFLNSGDLVEFGGNREQWIRFFNIEAPLMSQRPSFPAVGNHDNSQRLYFRHFFLTHLYAGGHRYYVQDWGDVRVIILDSEIEIREGSAQYDFLYEALREGAARNQLLVLSIHYPPYSSGEHGSNPEIQEVLGPLSQRFGVEVVLAGHDHDYERTKLMNGTTYIVAASGGAPIRRVVPQSFTAEFRTEPHYVLFDVTGGKMIVRAINLHGEVFDNFIIEPNPPGEAM